MTAFELQRERQSFIEELLSMSMEDFAKVKKYARKLNTQPLVTDTIAPPLSGIDTHEERMARLVRSEEDIRCGRVHPHEEVMRNAYAKIAAWKD